MITFKITPVFPADHKALFNSLFPGLTHCASRVEENVAYYSFEDDTVRPVDLGPIVKTEIIPNP